MGNKTPPIHKQAVFVLALTALLFTTCFNVCTAQNGSSHHTAAGNSNILPNGRQITPAGDISSSIGSMPLNIAVSPDGKYAITTSVNCLSTIRMSDGVVVSVLKFPVLDPTIPNSGLFNGLIFDQSPHNDGYTLYAAQGAYGTVAVLTLNNDGTLTRQHTIPTKPIPYMPVDQPAGIALANGIIYMTNYFSVDLRAPHGPASTLSAYRLSDGARLGSYTFMDEAHTNTPSFPVAIVVKTDGSRAYVASQRDGCVYVLDTTDPGNITLVTTIPNLSQPSALLFNKAQTTLYVANADSDTVSVIDVTGKTSKVKATILLRPTDISNLPGVSPSGLALSPDEKLLYTSLGDFNAVGVIDAKKNQLKGYIPAGWYPTALAASPDGKALLVVNGWGTTAMNPNPGFDYLHPDCVGIDFKSTPPSWSGQPGPGYILTSVPGNVCRIATKQALADIDKSTIQVIRNNQNTPAMDRSANKALEEIGIKSGKIKHVIYIIKENRSYDQCLGDLAKGNGDASLAIYGREVTPNQHVLAERFILLDNFYNNAPVSGEGWIWCTQGMANAFTIKTIPYVYQLSLPGYTSNYSYEGQVNGYITGGYPARDQDGNWLSSTHKAAPRIPNVTEAPGGYIWDGVRTAGLSFRNYGFLLSSGFPQNPPYTIPDNYPAVPGLCPPGHIPTPAGQVTGASDYDFRKFDFFYADSDAWLKYGFDAKSVGLTTGSPAGYYASSNSPITPQPSRFSEWNREFQEMLRQDSSGDSVPAFMTVRFMRNHSMGLNPGAASPRAMIADNDYAVGELVQAVSHSPIWKDTVIFVIEDDAQFGNDHVDAHRSMCFVISPWIKKATVDSHFYDTNSVLKSMELLLGLSPMSQYDHFAAPIMGGWDIAPNNADGYTAILPPKQIIGEVNPSLQSYKSNDPLLHLAKVSAGLNWSVADSVHCTVLNEILWKTANGADSKMPEPQFVNIALPEEYIPKQDDDD